MIIFNKEKVEQLILNSSQKHISVYKKGALNSMKKEDSLSEDEIEQEMLLVRKRYLSTVVKDVGMTLFKGEKLDDFKRYLKLAEPEHPYGIMAGALFELCYLTQKKRFSPYNNAIILNHKQNDILTECLHEMDDEYK